MSITITGPWNDTYFTLEEETPNAYFILDYLPPTGSIIINNGDEYTFSLDVNLTLHAEDSFSGVKDMMISNDPTFSDAIWEPYVTSKSWTLISGSYGQRIVYAKFRDYLDNVSDTISDSIEYTVSPELTIAITLDGVAKVQVIDTLEVILLLVPNKTVVEMKISEDPELLDAEWQPYSSTIEWTFLNDKNDVKTIYAQVKDALGMVSNIAVDSAVFSTEVVLPEPITIEEPSMPTIVRTGPRFLRERARKYFEFEVHIQKDDGKVLDTQLIETIYDKLTPAHTYKYFVYPEDKKTITNVEVFKGVGQFSNKWDQAIQEIYNKEPNRVIPFVSGFDPSDSSSINYVKEKLDAGFKGIGELFIFEIENRWTQNTIATERFDSPALIQICQLAASYNVPVSIHCDSQKATINDSQSDSFEYLLQQCPSTIFIWAHAGVNRFSAPTYPNTVARMLNTYHNLYCDISPTPYPSGMINQYLETKWIQMYKAYPTRFIIGTNITESNFQDIVVRKQIYDQINEIVGNSLYNNMFSRNMCSLLGIPKATIDSHTHLWTVDTAFEPNPDYTELLFDSLTAAGFEKVCLMGFPGYYPAI